MIERKANSCTVPSAAVEEVTSPTRPAFPVFTVLGTIGLLILVAVTLIRNHRHGSTGAPTGAVERPAAQVVAAEAGTPQPAPILSSAAQ